MTTRNRRGHECLMVCSLVEPAGPLTGRFMNMRRQAARIVITHRCLKANRLSKVRGDEA